jgi:sulfur-oxidizing protein SoxY
MINRRQALALGVGTAVTAGFGLVAGPVRAAQNDSAELIRKFTGGKEPAKGGLKLDLPEIAENGNTVPMTVSFEGPTSKDKYVQEILIVADGNPNGGVARFRFSPVAVPEANTRIRLAETQNVVAVAKMSDGSFATESKQVKVTIGGCGG